jgi:hypothetical protein
MPQQAGTGFAQLQRYGDHGAGDYRDVVVVRRKSPNRCGISPAGVTDRLWEIEDLVGLLDGGLS